MKPEHLGLIIISAIIIVGVMLVIPIFSPKHFAQQDKSSIMVVFNIVNNTNLPEWCKDLSPLIEKYNLPSTIFVTGIIADEYPICVNSFEQGVDVGTQTYSYRAIPSIFDYSIQLEQVKNGEMAVEEVGHLTSKLFRAPYGITDENIYSLLTSSGIVADFSYKDHYNLYQNGQFIRYDLQTFNGSSFANNDSLRIPASDVPVVIDFYNFDGKQSIEIFVSKLVADDKFDLLTASQVSNMRLTVPIK